MANAMATAQRAEAKAAHAGVVAVEVVAAENVVSVVSARVRVRANAAKPATSNVNADAAPQQDAQRQGADDNMRNEARAERPIPW